MINGLFFDSRAWNIDFNISPYWNPEAHNIHLDLYPDGVNVLRIPDLKKYKFALITEAWEIPMRRLVHTLQKDYGMKIFLVAREPFKSKMLKDAMFSHSQFFDGKEYYFTPDAVFAVGSSYAELWEGRAKKIIITGYPRFDYYLPLDKTKWPSKGWAFNEYGPHVDPIKKWIFFPDYPPYTYKKDNGKDTTVDLWNSRENTLKALYNFSKNNPEYQIVVKIHPTSMKPFNKGKGKKEVSGLLLKHLHAPDDHMVVLPDERNDGKLAKHLLMNADIVAGFASTMLLEASLLHKPCINVLFDETQTLTGLPEYDQYIPTVKNEKELHEALKNSNKYLPEDFVIRHLGKVDGNACKRICEAITELV